MQIHPVIHKILANKDFSVTNDLIFWLFVVTFVHSAYMQIAFIWNLVCENLSTGCGDTS